MRTDWGQRVEVKVDRIPKRASVAGRLLDDARLCPGDHALTPVGCRRAEPLGAPSLSAASERRAKAGAAGAIMEPRCRDPSVETRPPPRWKGPVERRCLMRQKNQTWEPR
jgi:hypothetical protein